MTKYFLILLTSLVFTSCVAKTSDSAVMHSKYARTAFVSAVRSSIDTSDAENDFANFVDIELTNTQKIINRYKASNAEKSTVDSYYKNIYDTLYR